MAGTFKSRSSLSPMDPNLTAIERAFQIAKSGDSESMDSIRRVLKKEGYQVEYINGPSVRRQLMGIIRNAKARRGLGPAET